MTIDILIITVSILINGFFAMSELAVVSSRRSRLQALVKRKVLCATRALALAEDPGRFLPTVQVGITVVGIFAGAFGGATLEEPLTAIYEGIALLEPAANGWAIATIVAAITYLSLILGELVPKQLALAQPERIAVIAAIPIDTLSRIAAPLVWVLRLSTQAVLGLLRVHQLPRQTVTDEDIKAVLTEGASAGVIKPRERELLAGVMRLANWRVRAIMTPRADIAWIDLNSDLETIKRQVLGSHYTRLVVARDSLDDVVGVVLVPEVCKQALLGQAFDVQALIRRPPVIPIRAPTLSVFEEIRRSAYHVAFIADENDRLAGLITANDVLKALLGERPQWTRRADGSWLIDGNAAVEVVKDLLGLQHLPGEQEYHNLAGVLLHGLEHVPVVGDHWQWGDHIFRVERMDGPRITQVLVTPIRQEPAPHDGADP